MKNFTALMLFLITANCLAFSVDPERQVEDRTFLRIFNSKFLGDGTVKVNKSKYDEQGEVYLSVKKVIMPQNEYVLLRSISESVYEMSAEDEDTFRGGTAFHIGHNLVLTNHHVLSPSRENLTECDDFKLLSHNRKESFLCKKVHYCHQRLDLCLIEMNPSKEKKKELKTGPKLKLSTAFVASDSEVMTAIGNSQGLGIHVSQARGAYYINQNINFFSAVTQGNSGGPLLDEKFNVVGLIKFQSEIRVGKGAFNGSSSIGAVVNILREKLKDNPETLEKFNEAVIQ